jgi:GDSL-like Lipase/Acylhydrolase
MDDYLAGHVIDPNALYIVWGGSNDLRNDPTFANVTATSARAAALVSRLAHAGAQFIMVPNIAPLGDIPRYADSPSSIVAHNRVAAQYRTQLVADLAALQDDLAGQGITPTIYEPDIWGGTVRIFSDGARFGFTNITTSAQDNSSANPDQFIFWDDKHPTTAAHFQIAQTAYDSIATVPAPVAKPANIATRVFVDTNERISIAGFIVTGDIPKMVLIRGIGPSLVSDGVPNRLANPTLTLFDANNTTLQSNDDWKSSPDAGEITNTGIAPRDDLESAIIATLPPGLYTAQLAGKDNTTGNGVVEVYDLDPAAASELANLSTRGFVGAGDNVMIGGVIIGSGDSAIMVFRAMGPSLAGSGISEPLQDPTIELHDQNGGLIAFNDDWKLPQIQAVQAVNLAPPDDRESVLVSPFLAAGSYTVIVRGKNDTTGIALVEAYRIQ